MTPQDIQKMDVTEIIKLPNFYSLTSCGGVENAMPYEPIKEPYWEIRLIGEINKSGGYKLFDTVSPHRVFLIHKFKKDILNDK